MPIQEFELLHGAVLTKIMRSGRPVTLRLVETRTSEAWATYTINDRLVVVKYATVPRARRDGSTAWTFTWSPTELRRVREAKERPDIYAALVCGRRTIARGTMEVCLLDLGELERCIDCSSAVSQTLQVGVRSGRSLRAWGPRTKKGDELVIPRNRLDTWELPG